MASSREPLDQFQPNLGRSIPGGRQLKFVKIRGLGVIGDPRMGEKG